MGVIKFGSVFTGRPKKTGARKRQRVKAQKKRLIAGGMKADVVKKLGVKQTRDACKEILRKQQALAQRS